MTVRVNESISKFMRTPIKVGVRDVRQLWNLALFSIFSVWLFRSDFHLFIVKHFGLTLVIFQVDSINLELI